MGGLEGYSPNSSVGLRAAKKRSKSLLGDWNSSNIKCVYIFLRNAKCFKKENPDSSCRSRRTHTENSGVTLQRGDSGLCFSNRGVIYGERTIFFSLMDPVSSGGSSFQMIAR